MCGLWSPNIYSLTSRKFTKGSSSWTVSTAHILIGWQFRLSPVYPRLFVSTRQGRQNNQVWLRQISTLSEKQGPFWRFLARINLNLTKLYLGNAKFVFVHCVTQCLGPHHVLGYAGCSLGLFLWGVHGLMTPIMPVPQPEYRVKSHSSMKGREAEQLDWVTQCEQWTAYRIGNCA